MSSDVFIKKVENYDQDEVNKAVEALFSGCGVDALMKNKERFLIKPNLLMRASPDEAVTTHPTVIRAVISALKKRGAKTIQIADSPGGPHTKVSLRPVYNGCGYASIGDIEGVTLNYVTDSRTAEIGGKMIKSSEIISPVLDADFIVNVGKLKTHMVSGMTGAVKNLFGTVPGLRKAELHCRFPMKEEFNDMLIDIAEFVKPQFSVVDGIFGMEGNGPSGGIPRGFGILAASENPYFLDCVLARCIGLSADEARTVKSSIKAGLAPKDFSDVRILGDTELFCAPLRDLKKPRSMEPDFSHHAPKFLRKIVRAFTSATSAHPVVGKSKCTGCGKCAEICPQKIVCMETKKAVIPKKGCIRCFCCHEICPARAIEVKTSGIWKL